MNDNHDPGDCIGDNPCDMCREYRHYRRASAAKRAKIISQTMKDTEATTELTATIIPEPDEIGADEHQCTKCGEICVVEWNLGGEACHPDCYCDGCEDQAGGFDHCSASADKLGDIIDRAMDEAKDRMMEE